MKIPSHELQAFYTLSQIGNFTRAAKALSLSQPAFSQRIKNLESFLEQTLFTREKSGIHLTPEGEKLLHYVRLQKEIEDEFLNFENSPQLRIAGFSSIMRSLVLPAISPLVKEYPQMSLELFTRELDELSPLLRSGQVDFVITTRENNKEGYQCHDLGEEENVLVAHKDHTKHSTFLDHDPNDSTTSSYFALSNEKPPQHKLYLDDVYGLRDGVKLGLGRAILPKHLIRKEKDLVIQRPRTVLREKVFLIHRDSPYMSEVHKKAKKILSQNLF